jgi:hypothetical protein
MMHKRRASLFTLLLVGALGLIFLTTGLAFAAPPAGTISYWKLDEAIAGISGAADAYEDVVNAPTGNNGEVPLGDTAPLPNPTGIVGGAQDFDDATDAINVPDPGDGSFDFAAIESFTIECWMKSGTPLGDGTSSQVLVGRNAWPVQWWLGMQGGVGDNPGNVSFVLFDSLGNFQALRPTTPVVPLNDNFWHHVVGVYNGATDTVSLYVDGDTTPVVTINGTGLTGGFTAAAVAELNLGWLDSGPGFHYEGTLDEVAFYSRALTPTEIKEHYDNGLAGHGIDYEAPPDPPDDDDDDDGGGGGGGGGCFISTIAE